MLFYGTLDTAQCTLHCYVSLIPCCVAKLSLLIFFKMVEENVVYSDITYVSVLQ